jgi:photosystem I P700 chlorophyll a apoprotein A1
MTNVAHTVFAQWIQNTHFLAPGATAPCATTSTKVTLLPILLETADFLVHHIHAFTIHVTVLILLKGVTYFVTRTSKNISLHMREDVKK